MVADAEGPLSATVGDEAPQEVQPPSHKKPTRKGMAIIENIATKVYTDSGSDVSLISKDFRMAILSLRTKAMQRSELCPRAVTGDY